MGQKILKICVNGIYTDGYTYHENLLPKYHKKNGNEVFILASEYEYDIDKKINKSNNIEYVDSNGILIKRLRIKGDKPITSKFKRFENFYKTIESINPDIIFCHLFQFVDVGEVVRYKKSNPNVKIYFDSHADTINSAHGFLSRNVLHKIIWKYYAKKAYNVAEKFYGVSPARVQFLRDIYGLPKEKTCLLVMGADDEMVKLSNDEQIKKSTREQYGVLAEDFVIITGGKIDRAKWQVLNLMKAAHKLPVKLIVFGSVSEDLLDDINKQTSDNVIFVGWKTEIEAYKLFAIANLAVFPATHSVYWEQVTGQGIPMIVRRWKGFEHLDLNGNLLYLEEGTEEEIENAIQKVLDKDVYNRMMKIAQEEGMKKFSYKALALKSIQ